jgi:hypothetical protein
MLSFYSDPYAACRRRRHDVVWIVEQALGTVGKPHGEKIGIGAPATTRSRTAVGLSGLLFSIKNSRQE